MDSLNIQKMTLLTICKDVLYYELVQYLSVYDIVQLSHIFVCEYNERYLDASFLSIHKKSKYKRASSKCAELLSIMDKTCQFCHLNRRTKKYHGIPNDMVMCKLCLPLKPMLVSEDYVQNTYWFPYDTLSTIPSKYVDGIKYFKLEHIENAYIPYITKFNNIINSIPQSIPSSDKHERKSALVYELGICGLRLRHDSKLCSGFINGTITNMDLQHVVSRMCEMRYLYEYCNMEEMLYNAYLYKCENGLHNVNIFSLAEDMALRKKQQGVFLLGNTSDPYTCIMVNSNYPKVFPWIM